MDLKDYLTTTEAAEKLGVNGSRIRQLIRDGKLPATKLGNNNLIKLSDLELVRVRPNGRPRKSK